MSTHHPGDRCIADSPSPNHTDRVLGCIMGAAIGDAMGHPVEFASMNTIHQTYGREGVTKYELFWGKGNARFAPYTDDTQMTEAVLRTLLTHRDAELDTVMTDMAARFVDWMKDPQGGHRAPGGACMAGCHQLDAGVPWHEAGGPTAGGCGSVMRAHPFGLVFADNLDKAELWAVEHSKLTHRDPIALAACAAMAVGVAHSLHGASPASIADAMIEAAGRYCEKTAGMLTRAREEALDGTAPGITLDRLRGWAAHEAIAAALYIFLRHPDDARAAILEGTNTPGDSDSLASMAGALVGARVGMAGLPGDWIAKLERTHELQALAGEITSPSLEPQANPAPFIKPSGKQSLDYILVIDLESTCWANGQRPRGAESEPIEIGLCVLNARTLERIEKRSILIKPQQTKVSAFCTELTTLTQAQVDEGVSFAKACALIQHDYNAPALIWGSFGDYDRTMMLRTCKRYGVKYPLGRTHINVKALYALGKNLPKQVELVEVLTGLGVTLEGQHHRGDDDAWNIALVLAWVLEGRRG